MHVSTIDDQGHASAAAGATVTFEGKSYVTGAGVDVGAVNAALGRLHLEGRLVPRDIQKAVELIRLEAVWDIEAMVEVAQLLAANPQVRLIAPAGFSTTSSRLPSSASGAPCRR